MIKAQYYSYLPYIVKNMNFEDYVIRKSDTLLYQLKLFKAISVIFLVSIYSSTDYVYMS